MASRTTTDDRDAALRELLVARVEASRAPGTRSAAPGPREPGRRDVAWVTGVVATAVVVGTVAVLTVPRPEPTAPAGLTMNRTSIPTTASPTAPPPSTATPAPAEATTPPPTAVAPTPPPATPTDRATATTAPSTAAPGGTLIARTGWHVITRAELHAYVSSSPIFADDAANAAVWEEQAWLDIGCMADKGYVYDPIAEHRDGEAGSASDGLTAAQRAGYAVAMYGPETDAPYDWRTAGCHGLSVHETGMDDAH